MCRPQSRWPIGAMIRVFGVVIGYEEGELALKPKTRHKVHVRVMVKCRLCKMEFPIPPARLKSARYCSNRCRKADHQSKQRATCREKPKAFAAARA